MNIKGSKHLTLGERIAISELSLRNSRTSLDCSLEKMALMDDTLTKGTKKGHIFYNLNQNNIDKLVSHINSYYRESIETTP